MADNLRDGFSVRRINLREMTGKLVAGVGLTTLLAVFGQATLAQQQDVVNIGRAQFDDKCVVCHGQEAKGDGVLAGGLNLRPADLTRLTVRYGGTFPKKECFDKIWGRGDEIIATHQMADMPAFYDAPTFGHDKNFEDSAGRLSPNQIQAIVLYLETIQEPEPIAATDNQELGN